MLFRNVYYVMYSLTTGIWPAGKHNLGLEGRHND